MGNFTTLPQWRRLRPQILERDGYLCRVRGPKCEGKATEVDHIIPWQDGGALYEPSNLRAACNWCNVWRANRQKARYGWKRSKTHIVLVVGPIAAGKSTYVAEHSGPYDLVVDYDAIAQALLPGQPRDAGHKHEVVNRVRGSLLTQVRRGEVKAGQVWIVSSNPEAESMFPYHEVVLVDPGRDEVMRRCHEERPASFTRLAEEWYRKREQSQVVGIREW